CDSGSCIPFAGHTDWRLPTVSELKSLVDAGAPGCGSGSPCINAVFGSVHIGSEEFYWSSSSVSLSDPTDAWAVAFSTSIDNVYNPGFLGKPFNRYVRAVREGW